MGVNNKKAAIIALIIIAVVWGYSFISSSKLINNGVGSDLLLFVRFGIGAIILGVLTFPKLKQATFNDIKAGIIVGMCAFFAMYMQNLSFKYTTVSKTAFISSASIILIPFLAYLINGTKITKRNIIGLTIALIGAAILSVDATTFTSINFGDFLAILSAFGFALQLVLLSKVRQTANPVCVSFFQMLFVAVGALVICFINSTTFSNLLAPGNIYSLLYLGVFATGLCYFVQAWSAGYVSEVVLSVIISSQAIFGSIFDAVVLHTPVTTQLVIGATLISIAILYLTLEKKKV